MKKFAFINILPLFLFIGFHHPIHAQYIEPDVVKNPEILIYPKTAFDTIDLKKKLAKGNATIKGEVITRKRDSQKGKKVLGGKTPAKHATVLLFPYTPYIAEYLKLKETQEDPKKNTWVEAHKPVKRQRLEAITNNKGTFTFPNMLPGKYYLICMVQHTAVETRYKEDGWGVNRYGYVVPAYYSYQKYNANEDLNEAVVEIKNDGEIIQVIVTNIEGKKMK